MQAAGVLEVAAIQMASTPHPPDNIARAESLIRAAAGRGARLVALPEHFSCYGPPAAIQQHAQSLDGPLLTMFAAVARELAIYLLLGSFPEKTAAGDKIYNTSVLLDPRGDLLAAYRKIHLFDVELPGRLTHQESRYVLPGETPVAVPLPEVGLTLGVAICYDLRFPELFRSLVDRGTQVIVLPSAFARETGRDHWEVLVRARAVENQIYVIAPNQYGEHSPGLVTYGRSLIVDPWGLVLAQAGDGEGTITTELRLEEIDRRRRELPCLSHRRLAVRDQI